MSQVYARNRRVSEFKFYTLALAIKAEVNRIALREKVIPKRYRFTNAMPLIEISRSAVYNITRADQFYPNSSFNVLERKKYLTLAIADIEMLCIELQTLIEMGRPDDPSKPPAVNAIDINKLEPLVEMVEEEIALLKGARKNVKLTGKQTIQGKIEATEAELSRLRDVQAMEESDDE